VETPSTTPTQAPEDATLKEFKDRLERYERDINQQKSTFQKRENEIQQAAREREEQLRAELERARTADMDEDELKIYRQEQTVLRARELEETNQRLQAQLQEQAAFNQAYNWFLQNDVPAKDLVIDQGYDALFQSGWAFINAERQRLKQSPQAPAAPPSPAAPPAPAVVTTTSSVPVTGTSWADLEAKYGSRENVYRLVETGQLPASVLPFKR
jgi:hypothetical protein